MASTLQRAAMPPEETNYASRSWAAAAFPLRGVSARARRIVPDAPSPEPPARWRPACSPPDTPQRGESKGYSARRESKSFSESSVYTGDGGKTVITHRGSYGMVIIPSEDNVLYGLWEAFTMFLIFSCAFFIPFDLMVCGEDHISKPVVVRWVNLLMDVVFAVDILVHFFLAYPKQAAHETDGWEVDQLRIAKRYCGLPTGDKRDNSHSEGMFWIDLVATVPSWLTRLRLVSRGQASKLLRVIRLTRVLRVANVGVRLEEVMSMHGLNLHLLEVLKTLVAAALTFHWMACVWVWVDDEIMSDQDQCKMLSPGACTYLLAVYWAVVTMTGTGYGDKVGRDMARYMICSVLMFLSAFMWAWVTGVMISVITELTRNSDRLKGEISDLEDFCDDRCLTSALRKEAKVYMLWSKDGPKHGLLDDFMRERLSPRLIWEVKHNTRSYVFDRVWWAKSITGSARAELCNLMTREYFGKYESFLPQRTLVFIKQGSARVNLKTLQTNDVWGAAQILFTQNECLWSRTLENLDCLLLSQDALKKVCDETSWVGALVRKEQVKIMVVRGLQRIASEIRKRKAIARNAKMLGPRHIHVSSSSSLSPSFSGGHDTFRYEKLRQELTELSMEMLVITRETIDIQEISRRQTQLAHQLRAQLDVLGASEAEPPGGPYGTAHRC